MPLHEYECEACAHRFEVIQKFSDPPVEVCPKCGSPVRKLIASPAIQFKGSGWYITDYARKEGTGAGKPSTAKEGSTESGTSTSSPSADTKAAPAAPASPTPTKSE